LFLGKIGYFRSERRLGLLCGFEDRGNYLMKMSVYQSSRLTKGNVWFPDRLRLEKESVVFEKRQLIGGEEESIRYEQIASVSVQRGFFFADLLFETTGGTEPIFLNGLWAGQAESAQAEMRLRMRNQMGSKEDRMLELLEEQNKILKQISAKMK
jgi:hypothetical protein